MKYIVYLQKVYILVIFSRKALNQIFNTNYHEHKIQEENIQIW